jgi:hypothetical protein
MLNGAKVQPRDWVQMRRSDNHSGFEPRTRLNDLHRVTRLHPTLTIILNIMLYCLMSAAVLEQ